MNEEGKSVKTAMKETEGRLLLENFGVRASVMTIGGPKI